MTSLAEQATACHYFSTYCIHGLHAAGPHGCRGTCKFCDEPCRCPCHGDRGERTPYGETMDRYRGIRSALENLLVNIEGRAEHHAQMRQSALMDEDTMIAETIRAILDNPTAALDD